MMDGSSYWKQTMLMMKQRRVPNRHRKQLLAVTSAKSPVTTPGVGLSGASF